MCGRFARKSTQEVLADWFGLELEEMPWFAPSYNAAPQSVQPAVRLNRDSGSREVTLLRWGLVPFWAKDAKIGYSTINARAEEAASKPAYRDAFKKRRCLVPADAFYEWQRLDPKTKRPFAFALASGEPFAFAGLWESWRPKEGDSTSTEMTGRAECSRREPGPQTRLDQPHRAIELDRQNQDAALYPSF